MSNQFPQGPSYEQYSQHPPVPPFPEGGHPPIAPKPPKKPRAWVWPVISIGTLVLGLVVGAGGSSGTDASSTPQPTVTVTLPNTGPSPDPITTPTNPPAPPAYVTPVAKDFKLAVKTLRKQCFGSAGCNITYRLSVDYVGKAVDPSKTYQVTYEVRGLEDGAAINTFTVQGDDITGAAEETGSTTSSKAKLTAVATGVMEG